MKHTLAFSLGIALLSAGIGTAHAQRAPISREDRRAQRRQSMQNMTPEQRQQFFQNQRQQRNNARPGGGGGTGTGTNAFQNNANGNGTNGNAANGTGGTGNGRGGRSRRNGGTNGTALSADAAHEARMRALMNAAGITDKAQQDPIVAFVLTQEKARQPLIKVAQDVATSLRDGKSTPAQITTKWTTYQTALDTDKARYKKDLDALDAKIGWSKDPRLESFLTLVGVITPDSLSLGGVQAIFVDAPTGGTRTPENTGQANTGNATNGNTPAVPARTTAAPQANTPPVNTPTAEAPAPIPPGTRPMLVD